MRFSAWILSIVGMAVHALPAVAQTVAESEPNDTPATADTAFLGGKATGWAGHSQSDTDKGDYWVVFAEAGDTIYVDVDACPRCVDAHISITLLASDGVTVLTRGERYDGDDETLSYVAAVSGRYFVSVIGNMYGPPPYTLSFSRPAPCPTDPTEPNNSIATAVVLDPFDDRAGRWCPIGDVDWYRIDMTWGMVLEFWVSDAKTFTYTPPKLRLHDANGTLIGSVIIYTGSYPIRRLVYRAPSDGPLYIVPATAMGSLTDFYRLHVRTHPARPTGLTLARAAGELMRPGEVLTAAESLYLDGLGNKNGFYDVGDFRTLLQLERGASDWQW